MLVTRSSLIFIMDVLYQMQAGGCRSHVFKAKIIHYGLIVSSFLIYAEQCSQLLQLLKVALMETAGGK